jgi:hypothetical protein
MAHGTWHMERAVVLSSFVFLFSILRPPPNIVALLTYIGTTPQIVYPEIQLTPIPTHSPAALVLFSLNVHENQVVFG